MKSWLTLLFIDPEEIQSISLLYYVLKNTNLASIFPYPRHINNIFYMVSGMFLVWLSSKSIFILYTEWNVLHIFLSLFTHDPNLCISHLFWIKWRVNAYPFYIMYWIIFLFLVFYRSKIYISIVYSVKKAFLKIQSGKCNKQNAKYILENAKCKIFFIFKNTIFQMKSVKWNL